MTREEEGTQSVAGVTLRLCTCLVGPGVTVCFLGKNVNGTSDAALSLKCAWRLMHGYA